MDIVGDDVNEGYKNECTINENRQMYTCDSVVLTGVELMRTKPGRRGAPFSRSPATRSSTLVTKPRPDLGRPSTSST